MSVTQFAWSNPVDIADDTPTLLLTATFENVPVEQPILLTPTVSIGSVDADTTTIDVFVVNHDTSALIAPTMTVTAASGPLTGLVIPSFSALDASGQQSSPSYDLYVHLNGAGGPSTGVAGLLAATWMTDVDPHDFAP